VRKSTPIEDRLPPDNRLGSTMGAPWLNTRVDSDKLKELSRHSARVRLLHGLSGGPVHQFAEDILKPQYVTLENRRENEIFRDRHHACFAVAGPLPSRRRHPEIETGSGVNSCEDRRPRIRFLGARCVGRPLTRRIPRSFGKPRHAGCTTVR